MPPLHVTALTDQLRAAMVGRDLAAVGPVDLGPEGTLPNAELAAKIVLADVGHWEYLEHVRGRRVGQPTWAHLAEQMRRLLGYAASAR